MIRSTALFTADKPMVSICCSTFNHENFIGEALDGFLMQKCDFPVEILIHEDCSTDNTAVIIKEYQQKFSDIIKPKFQKENQYSKGVKPISQLLLPRSQGKYIALCEGDDYWTDPYKLQNQVDFLEANEDFAICHHNMQVIYEENNNKPHLSNPPDGEKFTTIETLAHGNYIYTASCVFRDGLFGEFPNWFAKCPIGDYPLHMLNAQFGKIRYFPEIMGVYRVHNGGVWEYIKILFTEKKSGLTY
ncbi:MAG: glycosyltransferase [Bacteroidota bacterium]|nr:glycosyltransferase [Bacteroidota bacterium]